MNYPVWELYSAGGGLLIAVIAVVHVYVAHFAVGGGFFLVITELKGFRENSEQILDYTKKHTKFFLLLTMVFGAVTGVGIWFTISLISPGATSTLIHTFVFGFATEWVFFLAEIAALFIYFYSFGKTDKRTHLKIGWLYALFAWLSLFMINGIIGFMLTPGQWIETKNFWDGFFNPTMWPALFFRTALSLIFAGIFGLITAVFIRESSFRETMVRYCVRWLLLPFFLIPLFGLWYLSALPGAPKAMILGRSPEIVPLAKIFIWILPVLFLGGLLMAARTPGVVKKPMAFGLLVIGLIAMGAFESIREAGRRPYLIYGHTYSTSIRTDQEKGISKKGLLQTAKWVEHRTITKDNSLEAGREIFNISCIACHSVNGPANDILPLTRKFSVFGMDAQLNGQGKINDYMPRFMGTAEERSALARFIVAGLHRKKEIVIPAAVRNLPSQIPPFDEKTDPYVLLAWNGSGMHWFSYSSRFWMLKPPGNTFYAQLIRRGETPEIVTNAVELIYTVEPGFEHPSNHIDFWDFAEHYFGKKLPRDTGLSGNGLNGKMKFDEGKMAFFADLIPIAPFRDDGTFNPYPLFTIKARDKESGQILAQTKTSAPVSTEMGCKNCHGGSFRKSGAGGIIPETAMDILALHDRISKTDLLKPAKNGAPVRCRSCHGDPIRGTAGNPKLLNLSAAVHGFHANYLTDRDSDACHACHPSSPTGSSRFFRGIHNELEMGCVNCHGKMEDHAFSLLLAEKSAGKISADRLLKHLSFVSDGTEENIAPRTPWINAPDCLNCHIDFEPPETDMSELNRWTKNRNQLYRMRADDAGVMCAACHGSAHAVYPSTNPYGSARDNIAPLQLQKNRYPIGANKNCRVCHTIDMEDEIHHPNMLTMFRN